MRTYDTRVVDCSRVITNLTSIWASHCSYLNEQGCHVVVYEDIMASIRMFHY